MSMNVVGIDLGTTISLLAVEREDGRLAVIDTRDGGARLRSVVHVAADGATTVGEAAERLAPLEPDAVFAFFKRSMGKDWSVAAGGRAWTPTDLSAAVLEALLADAGSALEERPRQAVITIPAYFGEDARRATLQAAESAGLDVRALLHEPTAACIASRTLLGERGTILVYDLGGGTFDVSVVAFTADGAEVLATAGDHRLGGKDWDDLIVDMVAEQVGASLDEDPRDDPAVLAELQERAREAKHTLSRMERAAVTLHAGGRVHRVEIERASFWARGQALYDRTAELIARVVQDVGGAAAIDNVLLAGGSTRMPPCAEVVRAATGHGPLAGIDPDEAVVRGAAQFAAAFAGSERNSSRGGLAARISDVTAHALGFVVVSSDGSRYVNEIMIPRNARLPAEATKCHELELPSAPERRILSVYMLQGEAERPLDTDSLGVWRFANVPGDASGPVKVNVSYRYDEDGVVVVSASLDGLPLPAPEIDRADRDLAWTEEDPASLAAGELAVVLAIDVSTSMRGEKLAEAKSACLGFIEELEQAGSAEQVAVVSFGSDARTVSAMGESPERQRLAVQALEVTGSTNLAAGLQRAQGELAAVSGKHTVVVLTDGAPDDRDAALAIRETLVTDGVELIARGVAGADEQFLGELATGDGELVGDGELGGNFRGIARQLLSATAVSRL
jgi:molecular chaperone DnaK (HSP70)